MEELLHDSGVACRHVRDNQSGFNIQCYDERGEDQVLQLNGRTIEGHKIKINRTRMQFEASDIFRTIGEHLRSTEEAEAIRISLGGSKRVSTVDTELQRRESRDSPHRRSSSPNPIPRVTLEYRPAPVAAAPYVAPVQRFHPPAYAPTYPRQDPYQSSYPLPEIQPSSPWYREKRDKWVSNVSQPVLRNRPPLDRNMNHDKDNYAARPGKGEQKGGKGKGKGKWTRFPDPPVQSPPPLPAGQSAVVPNCPVCESAGRMARHESYRCTFANPPAPKPVA